MKSESISQWAAKCGNIKKLQKALKNRAGTVADKRGAAKRVKKVQKYTRDKRSPPQSPCFSTHTLAYCHTRAAAPVVSAFSPGCWLKKMKNVYVIVRRTQFPLICSTIVPPSVWLEWTKNIYYVPATKILFSLSLSFSQFFF